MMVKLQGPDSNTRYWLCQGIIEKAQVGGHKKEMAAILVLVGTFLGVMCEVVSEQKTPYSHRSSEDCGDHGHCWQSR